jgi:Na+:H+ antiporter, NhaC family
MFCKTQREPVVTEIAFLFGAFVLLMYLGVAYWKAPTIAILFVATFLFAGYGALVLGCSWQKIQTGIVENIAGLLPAFLILLIVGSLIGTWLMSGVIPLMIYYGLNLLAPSYFLVAATAICCVVSLSTGTSWGTLSTIGIALMGVATGLNIYPPIAAGAIVVGAYFGDKMSPLSATCNVAAGVAEANLFEHTRYLIHTTGPALLISLGLYMIYSWQFQPPQEASDLQRVQSIINGLQASFNLSPLLLFPPVLALFLIYKRMPVMPVLAVSTIVAGLMGIALQSGVTVSSMLTAMYSGFTAKTGLVDIDKLLSGGGIASMGSTVLLLIAAISVGGTLRAIGILDVCLRLLRNYSNTPARLVSTTQIANILIILITGSCYLSISLVGPMFATLYDRLGLARVNLSRTLEDSGTVIVPIVPWGISGVFTAKTLGVPVMDYLLYAPLCYTSVFFAIGLAYMGWLRRNKEAVVIPDAEAESLVKA